MIKKINRIVAFALIAAIALAFTPITAEGLPSDQEFLTSDERLLISEEVVYVLDVPVLFKIYYNNGAIVETASILDSHNSRNDLIEASSYLGNEVSQDFIEAAVNVLNDRLFEVAGLLVDDNVSGRNVSGFVRDVSFSGTNPNFGIEHSFSYSFSQSWHSILGYSASLSLSGGYFMSVSTTGNAHRLVATQTIAVHSNSTSISFPIGITIGSGNQTRTHTEAHYDTWILRVNWPRTMNVNWAFNLPWNRTLVVIDTFGSIATRTAGGGGTITTVDTASQSITLRSW